MRSYPEARALNRDPCGRSKAPTKSNKRISLQSLCLVSNSSCHWLQHIAISCFLFNGLQKPNPPSLIVSNYHRFQVWSRSQLHHIINPDKRKPKISVHKAVSCVFFFHFFSFGKIEKVFYPSNNNKDLGCKECVRQSA